MKNKLIFLIALIILIIFVCIIKMERINSIKIDVYLDSNGDAHVTEIWDANPAKQTEYYHAYYNLMNSSIENYKVKDESKEYTYIDWNIDGSLEDKAYHYGYNYDYDGVELCFGKSSYKHHKYTLTYTIKNFVYNTVDGKQVIYWTMLNKINPAPKKALVVIHSDNNYSHNLPVFGYGSNGSTFVADKTQTNLNTKIYDGQIVLYNNHLKNTDYMTVLAVFEPNTFNTNNVFNYSISEIKTMAHYDEIYYKKNIDKIKKNKLSTLYYLTLLSLIVLLPIILLLVLLKHLENQVYGGTKKLIFAGAGNKIDDDVPMFRDLPCGKNIKRAYWIAVEYGIFKRKTDFLGAMLLKWIKEGKVKVENKEKGIFDKETVNIVFNTQSILTDDAIEGILYKYMYEASNDGVLENEEFEEWCRNNYSEILDWFDTVIDNETLELTKENKIIYKESRNISKKDEYIVDESMKEEAIKMAGLKKFFDEFDNMTDKEAIDVMLWEEYLIYAQIFGVAEKVAKQFKKLYPDVITDYDYNTFEYIHDISYSGIELAKSNHEYSNSSSDRDYFFNGHSSGGGGFSSGGGGGGSFGGGGGSFGGGSR